MIRKLYPTDDRLPLPKTLDKGIAAFVEILCKAGVETYESCQGGAGHSFPEPTVRFHGTEAAGWEALAVAMYHALPVYALRRVWQCRPDGPDGPFWEMTFYRLATAKIRRLPSVVAAGVK
jgi:hypothetical protein